MDELLLPESSLFSSTWISISLWLKSIEDAGARLALGKAPSSLASRIPCSRLLLLPLAPVPIPSVHEFSYLLAADKIAHGRLQMRHITWIFAYLPCSPTPYVFDFPTGAGHGAGTGTAGKSVIGVLLSVADVRRGGVGTAKLVAGGSASLDCPSSTS